MTREEILRDKAEYEAIVEYNKPIIEKYNLMKYRIVDDYKAKYCKAFGIDEVRYRIDINEYACRRGSGRIVNIEREKGDVTALRWHIRVEYDEENDEVKFESGSWSGAQFTTLEGVDDLVESASVIERILKYPDFKTDYLTLIHDLDRIEEKKTESVKIVPCKLSGRNFERELKNLEHEQLKERLFNGEWYKLIKWDRYHNEERVEAVVRVRRQTEKTVWYDYANERTYWENNECVHTGEYRLWQSDVRCLKSNFTYAPNGKFEAEFTDEEKENYSYRYEAMPDDFKPVSRW